MSNRSDGAHDEDGAANTDAEDDEARMTMVAIMLMMVMMVVTMLMLMSPRMFPFCLVGYAGKLMVTMMKMMTMKMVRLKPHCFSR